MDLAFSPAAQDDLRTIVRWGIRRWGETAAREYVEELRQDIDRLHQFPELGRSVEDLFPGARVLTTGTHRVFYRIDGDTVRIVRVLHQRASSADRGQLRRQQRGP